MVWPFKKRKDVIDLTYLAKRGLIKLPEREEEYKDINPMNIGKESSGSDALSFLSNLAGSSSSSGSSSGSASSLGEEKHDAGMKNKVEDFEFKLDTMRKRIDQLMDRIDLLEKKLARNERAG